MVKRPSSLQEIFSGGSSFPQGIPNPDRIGAGIDVGIWSYLRDQSESIAEIAARLGRPAVTHDAAGYEIEIVGGAFDPVENKLAWIQSRSKTIGDMVDVEFRLFATCGGRPLFDWEVATYNPYFGCHVGFVAWYGDAVLLTYHEKHRQILARVSADEARLVDIGDIWLRDGDSVLFDSEDEPELLEVRALPSLEARLPRTLDMVDERGVVAGLEFLGDLPLADCALLVAETGARLFDEQCDEVITGLLVGALAYKFCLPPPAPRLHYPRSWSFSSPTWLPFYVAEDLQGAARESYLALLGRAAAYEPRPLEPATAHGLCAAELAARYIAGRLPALLEACERHELPKYACNFWRERSLELLAPELSRFPAGFRSAFESLARNRKRWLELSQHLVSGDAGRRRDRTGLAE